MENEKQLRIQELLRKPLEVDTLRHMSPLEVVRALYHSQYEVINQLTEDPDVMNQSILNREVFESTIDRLTEVLETNFEK